MTRAERKVLVSRVRSLRERARHFRTLKEGQGDMSGFYMGFENGYANAAYGLMHDLRLMRYVSGEADLA